MSIFHSEARVPTSVGVFRVRIYGGPQDTGPVAIVGGESFSSGPTTVRIHSTCFISENLGCLGCDCRQRLAFALQHIAAYGGVVVYLRGESSGRGLADQIRKGACRFSGHSSLDRESLETAARVLRDLGVQAVQLMTDGPSEADALAKHGVSVAGWMPMSPLHGTIGVVTGTAGSFPGSALVPGQSLDGRPEGLHFKAHAPSGRPD